jgi:hypothetical protein
MIINPQFHAARRPLDRTIAPQAEASAPGGLTMPCAGQVEGAPDLAGNNLVELQRVAETAATVSIDGDAAVNALVRVCQT